MCDEIALFVSPTTIYSSQRITEPLTRMAFLPDTFEEVFATDASLLFQSLVTIQVIALAAIYAFVYVFIRHANDGRTVHTN